MKEGPLIEAGMGVEGILTLSKVQTWNGSGIETFFFLIFKSEVLNIVID